MKIDLPNLIYIIAIIAWVIIGFVRKNKKKEGRPATTMPPVGEPQQPEFGDILEEILGKKREEKKPVVVPQPKPEKQKKIIQPKTSETISAPHVRSFQHSSANHQEKTILNSEKEKKPVVNAEEISTPHVRGIFEESEFDLRKAVIYSEILKPPYLD